MINLSTGIIKPSFKFLCAALPAGWAVLTGIGQASTGAAISALASMGLYKLGADGTCSVTGAFCNSPGFDPSANPLARDRFETAVGEKAKDAFSFVWESGPEWVTNRVIENTANAAKKQIKNFGTAIINNAKKSLNHALGNSGPNSGRPDITQILWNKASPTIGKVAAAAIPLSLGVGSIVSLQQAYKEGFDTKKGQQLIKKSAWRASAAVVAGLALYTLGAFD